MEPQTAFNYKENMAKLTVIPHLPTPVILKEKRHFAHYWSVKEKALGWPLRL